MVGAPSAGAAWLSQAPLCFPLAVLPPPIGFCVFSFPGELGTGPGASPSIISHLSLSLEPALEGALSPEGSLPHYISLCKLEGGAQWQRVTQFASKQRKRPALLCFPLFMFPLGVDDRCLKCYLPLKITFTRPQVGPFS